MDFEELGKKLKKFSQDTMTEVQKMNEVRQLNGKISDEKKLLNRLYLEMGQKLYDTYKDVELPLEEFDSDFRKIRERYVAIDLLQEKIRNVKGVVLCPCCNMEVAAGDRYCTNCGNKMPETKCHFSPQKNPGSLTVPGCLTLGHNVPYGTLFI